MLDDDEYYEPPPYRPAHPRREAFTMTVAACVVITAVSYLIWKFL